MFKPRLIAFYLPQFYPTPENDKWWGKGFTEWTNVGRAKPLFKGHYQPRVPADLGYYDLRISEVREEQARLAKEAGIEGFCYWHYWFGNNKRLLHKVFSEVVESGKPDFPFCLCWANHSWAKKTWDPNQRGKDVILVEQIYPGVDDYTKHFYAMLPAFKDKRYMKTMDGKLIFGFYDPLHMVDTKTFFDLWNKLAKQEGLAGFYFFAYAYNEDRRDKALNKGFDAVTIDYLAFASHRTTIWEYIKREFLGVPSNLFKYENYVKYFLANYCYDKRIIPCPMPNYDHSPRSQRKGIILSDSTPALWKELLEGIIQKCQKDNDSDEQIIFIKAWNEWGEGNYLEPDLKFGKKYLDVIKNVVRNMNNNSNA